MNTDGHENLADIREREERAAAAIMGVSSCEMLRYKDGTLCSANYHAIADKITAVIRRRASRPDSKITLLTFDPHGISGHLDHIAVSMITTYVYLGLGVGTDNELKYFCIPEEFSPAAHANWIYMPKGRSQHEIDEIIDVRAVREQKIAAINAHRTQAHDAALHLARGDALLDEHFVHYKD